MVDAQLQTSAPNVYALGDGAQYANGRTLPYVMPIMHAGKALAHGSARAGQCDDPLRQSDLTSAVV